MLKSYFLALVFHVYAYSALKQVWVLSWNEAPLPLRILGKPIRSMRPAPVPPAEAKHLKRADENMLGIWLQIWNVANKPPQISSHLPTSKRSGRGRTCAIKTFQWCPWRQDCSSQMKSSLSRSSQLDGTLNGANVCPMSAWPQSCLDELLAVPTLLEGIPRS